MRLLRLRTAQGERHVPDAVRHLALAHQGQRFRPPVRNQRHNVGVRAKARALGGHVIGHNQVQMLGKQLSARVFQHVLRLGGKAHQHLAGLLPLPHGPGNIRGFPPV